MNRRTFLQAAPVGIGLSYLSSNLLAQNENGTARHPLLATQNPIIIRGRDAAMGVLKPNAKDLEHGLNLHEESIVFDSYGFAPRASVDGEALAKLDAAHASDVEFGEARTNMSMIRPATEPKEREEFQEAFRCAGVTCIFQNAGEEGQAVPRLLQRLARFTFLTDMQRDVLVRASLPVDIENAKKAGKHCLYLTGNGTPLPQTWISVQEELAYVQYFFQLGIRMMHLTYNRRNMLADGCAETANGGLSDFGRAAIAEMNRVGVIVDVAHTGWRSSREAAEASTKPMVASHTACNAINEHIRAKPDDVIKAICNTGGLVGICLIPNFLGGSGDISRLLDHIDYVVKKFGIDHVAIGTDVAHTSQYSAEENKKVPKRDRRRSRFAALWPSGSLGGNWPGRATLAWTNWPLITVGLVQRGYSDEEIQKIIGGNVMRVCKEVLPEELQRLNG
ncbi:dipeptidase [Thalassoglobus polymorphus]|uniref:Membrane dipeptidase (Peptidase family M19) n=1 Tax=Thalassoglobus polymorphus TaxID=2527994 RepID=A0A517QLS4_9PLAN|nr:membrane dipeptidase [Thalassoglobus polymorphus]QDT32590.1 Membrane dipeptidase (Peptidase family M19) [Thalassoglobus polymorphus]